MAIPIEKCVKHEITRVNCDTRTTYTVYPQPIIRRLLDAYLVLVGRAYAVTMEVKPK